MYAIKMATEIYMNPLSVSKLLVEIPGRNAERQVAAFCLHINYSEFDTASSEITEAGFVGAFRWAGPTGAYFVALPATPENKSLAEKLYLNN